MSEPVQFEFIAQPDPVRDIFSVAVSDSGRLAICHRLTPAGAKYGAVASVWDGPTATREWEVPIEWPYTCAIAPDGMAYVGQRTFNAGPSSVKALDAETGKTRHTITLPFDQLKSCALSPDGTILAVVGNGSDQIPRLYETADLHADPRKAMKGNKAGVMQVLSWSPEGQWLISLAEKSSGAPEHTIAVRPPNKRKRRWHGIARNAIASSEQHIVTLDAGAPSHVRLWDFDSDEPVAARVLDDVRMYPLGTLALIDGGRSVAVAMSNKLYVLRADDLSLQRAWKLYSATGACLAASPNGRYLAIVAGDTHRVFLAEAAALIAPG